MRRTAVFLFVLAFALPAAAANLGSSPMNVDGLTIDLLSVERKGAVVTVKWAVRNGGAKEGRAMFVLDGKKATTYLVDEENGTKYFALSDKEGQLLATEDEYEGIWEGIDSGQTKRFWAKFPAPPPAVKSINVLFSDADPFEGIAITDK